MKRIGRGIHRKAGSMNSYELAYSRYLEGLKHSGSVLWFEFEPMSLKLAPSTHYRPDFLVQLSDLTLEIHEVKGHWEEKARIKIKVAADKFPFRFIAITKEKGLWVREEF